MGAPETNGTSDRPEGIGGWGIVTLAIAVGLTRLLPGAWAPWNLKPVGGLCLFAGARFRSPLAYLVPLAVMIVTDLILMVTFGRIGMSAIQVVTAFVYVSFLIDVVLGRLVRDSKSPILLGLVGGIGVAQFFLITNFGSWLTGGYPLTFAGLMEAYAAGLPFLRHTLVADLGGFLFFIGANEYAARVRRQAIETENASEPT